jgi:hypothetical protein
MNRFVGTGDNGQFADFNFSTVAAERRSSFERLGADLCFLSVFTIAISLTVAVERLGVLVKGWEPIYVSCLCSRSTG